MKTLKTNIIKKTWVGSTELALVRSVDPADANCVVIEWHFLLGPTDKRFKSVETAPLFSEVMKWRACCDADVSGSAWDNGGDTFVENCGHNRAAELSAETREEIYGTITSGIQSQDRITEALVSMWACDTLASILDCPSDYGYPELEVA